MSNDAVRQFIDQAIEAIQKGRHQEALELLDRAIHLDDSNSEAIALEGVAYSALGQGAKATEAFRKAIGLAPHNSKAFYNFSVHLYGLGDKSDALEMAREAVRVEPGNIQAREMASRIERETGAAPLDLPPPMTPEEKGEESTPDDPSVYQTPSEAPNYFRDPSRGEYETPVHSLAFVEKMKVWWDVSGWILAAINLAFFVWAIVHFVQQSNVGLAAVIQSSSQSSLDQSSGFQKFNLIGVAADQGLLVLWLGLDLADRRGNWLWLLPYIVSCCCCANWIMHLLYVFTGRSSR